MTERAPGPLVLVIEDEPQIRRFLRASLPSHGYRLIEAATGRDGLAAAAIDRPDLVLLDLGLPDTDGVEVISSLREWTEIPILVLTARGRERDKISVLDAGADDYLTKPFGVGELMARMRVALRRSSRSMEASRPILAVGPFTVDLACHRVWLADKEIKLSVIEFKLLAELARHAGKVLTHRHLLTNVWGPEYLDQTHYLRVYMGHLRHKLEVEPAQPRFLLTEPGVGYRLEAGE